MNVDDIKRVACIGAGTIGGSWATYFAMKGLNVNLYTPIEVELGEARDTIQSNLEILIEKNLFPADSVLYQILRSRRSTVLFCSDYQINNPRR